MWGEPDILGDGGAGQGCPVGPASGVRFDRTQVAGESRPNFSGIYSAPLESPRGEGIEVFTVAGGGKPFTLVCW